MLMLARFILSLWLLYSCPSFAAPQSVAWFGRDAANHVTITVDLFLSEGCPHCHKADAFFQGLEKKEPWVIVHRHIINQDKAELQLFYERLKQQHSTNFSVPALFFCDSRWVGFDDDESSGKAFLRGLNFCRKNITTQGELRPDTVRWLREWGGASQYEMSHKPSPLTFVFMAAVAEALTPCSLFCFFTFLSFLWLYPTNRGRQLGIGVVFMGALLFIHYLLQAQSAVYYQYLTHPWLLRIFVGLLLLFFVAKCNKSKEAPTPSMSFWVWLLVFLSPIAIWVYQQTCTFNMALVYEQWFSGQSFSPLAHVMYRLEYQFAYVLPAMLCLALFFFFGRHPRIASHHRLLCVAAYLMLMCIGVALIIYPQVLANMWASYGVFLVAFVAGWFISRREKKQEW